MKFKTACLQLSSQGDIEANARAIEAMVREAVAAGAQLACLPENAFLMQNPKPSPSGRGQGEGGKASVSLAPLTPPLSQGEREYCLCPTRANEHKIWIIIGSLHVPVPDAQRCFNRSVLINDAGEVAATYDKIHLFDVTLADGEIYKESDRMAPGAKAVLALTPWGKLGMSVCYDLRFPHLYRALAKADADFLSIPARAVASLSGVGAAASLCGAAAAASSSLLVVFCFWCLGGGGGGGGKKKKKKKKKKEREKERKKKKERRRKKERERERERERKGEKERKE